MHPIVAELTHWIDNGVELRVHEQAVWLILVANGLFPQSEHACSICRFARMQPTNSSTDICVRGEMQLTLVDQRARQRVLAILVDDAGLLGKQVEAEHTNLGASIALAMPHLFVGTAVLQNHP